MTNFLEKIKKINQKTFEATQKTTDIIRKNKDNYSCYLYQEQLNNSSNDDDYLKNLWSFMLPKELQNKK